MDTVSSRPLRLLPSLPQPPPPSAGRYHHHGRCGSIFLSSSVRFVPPAAAISSRLRRPPATMLRRTRSLKPRHPRGASVVASAQFNVAKVLTAAWKVARDGVEAGANLLPDSVPRPIARICVAGVVGVVTLFLLKSLLSTALFVLAMMGLIYFIYMAFNAGEGPSNGGSAAATSSDEETLEEARRIMEKYK